MRIYEIIFSRMKYLVYSFLEKCKRGFFHLFMSMGFFVRAMFNGIVINNRDWRFPHALFAINSNYVSISIILHLFISLHCMYKSQNMFSWNLFTKHVFWRFSYNFWILLYCFKTTKSDTLWLINNFIMVGGRKQGSTLIMD